MGMFDGRSYQPTLNGMGGGGFNFSNFMGGPWGMALASFGLPLLGAAFGGNRQHNRLRDEQNKLMNSSWLFNRTGEYQNMFQQMANTQRGNILTAGNAFQNRLGRNLASTGMNRTGIGALASTAAASMPALQLADLQGEVRRGAFTQAMGDRDRMLAMLNQGGTGQFQNPYAAAFGSGSMNFMQYLMDMYGNPRR